MKTPTAASIIKTLGQHRKNLVQDVTRAQKALDKFNSSIGRMVSKSATVTATHVVKSVVRKRKAMSAAARRKISKAQKARWAATKKATA